MDRPEGRRTLAGRRVAHNPTSEVGPPSCPTDLRGSQQPAGDQHLATEEMMGSAPHIRGLARRDEGVGWAPATEDQRSQRGEGLASTGHNLCGEVLPDRLVLTALAGPRPAGGSCPPAQSLGGRLLIGRLHPVGPLRASPANRSPARSSINTNRSSPRTSALRVGRPKFPAEISV